MKSAAVLIVLLCELAFCAHGARILGIFPVPCRSHLGVYTYLTKELAKRGHELVVMTPFPTNQPPPNHTDINFMPSIREYYEENLKLDFYSYNLPIHFPLFMWHKSLSMIRMVFSDPAVQAVLYDSRGFDLVICEDLITESLCAFADYFKAPRVLISSIGGYHMINYAVGNPLELAYVPSQVLPYTDHMSFYQRLVNFLFTAFWDLGNELFYMPRQEAIRKQVFGDNTSSVWEMRSTASLVLLNNHFTLNYPRPFLPSMVEVGGLHIKPKPDPLPAEIKTFLDGATHGAIYFSMGSNLRSDAMSPDKIAALIAAFSELPQRVLMKWESDTMPGKPRNVMLGAWLPQQDILAHPNVRVFVTHGGIMSGQESAYHGVPLVGIPVFGDQTLNMLKAEQGGFGVMLSLKNVTKQSLLWAINKALTDERIIEEARRRSVVFRDQPETPLDRAIFWVEYVLRHGGAPHMRSASVDLAWYQRLMLDVAAALVLGLVCIIYVTRALLLRNRSASRPLTKKMQ